MGESTSFRSRAGRLFAVALLVAPAALALSPLPAQAAQSAAAYETCLLDLVNTSRLDAGSAPLAMATDLVAPVEDHSRWMRYHKFEHMDSAVRDQILPDGTWTWGENIAMWSNPSAPCSQIHNMFMNSPGHRANILNPNFEFAAIGAYIDDSGVWVTELFFKADHYSPDANGTFWDDDSSIFEEAIEKLAASGITNGCNPPINDRFCPDEYVSRGQMAAFLSRGLGLPPGHGIDFIDDDGSIFEDAIERLATAGITNGCNPPTQTRFCPTRLVTRGEMAAFLVRGLDLQAAGGTDFIDDDGSIFESAIQRLSAAGITNGCNPPANDRFCPDDNVTRGQMAAFLVRALRL
jgi:uncharacterized protein YkwD